MTTVAAALLVRNTLLAAAWCVQIPKTPLLDLDQQKTALAAIVFAFGRTIGGRTPSHQ